MVTAEQLASLQHSPLSLARHAARADVFTGKITLAADADTTVFDADGSAIIIHAQPDSYGAEPGAGDRVACGVIERS